jgi:hypothetical protein
MIEGQPRFPLYLVTGLALGLAIGLWFSWVAAPVEIIDTHPVNLREDFKARFRETIALAYTASGDLNRASARLALLGDPDLARGLAVQAQITLAEDGSEEAARALGLLAAALGGQLPENAATVASSDGTPDAGETANATGTLQATRTPRATLTPLPTQTPTATQGAPYVLEDLELVCDPDLGEPLIQVFAFDSAGQPVPGVAIHVAWGSQENTFYTGLKPEFGLGYADFTMAPEELYTLSLAEGGEPVTGLAATDCDGPGGTRYLGSWRLTFRQP